MKYMGTLWRRAGSLSHRLTSDPACWPGSDGLMLSQTPHARSLPSDSGSTDGDPPNATGGLVLCSLDCWAIHRAPMVAPWPAPMTTTLELLASRRSFLLSR